MRSLLRLLPDDQVACIPRQEAGSAEDAARQLVQRLTAAGVTASYEVGQAAVRIGGHWTFAEYRPVAAAWQLVVDEAGRDGWLPAVDEAG